jgi:ferritin-like metal-binding protein YciE
MNASQKITQYLSEARASEDALIRVLQSQIAMTPNGSYRTALETHLEETRRHSDRVADRLSRLDQGWSPMLLALGVWEDLAGQALALGKLPFDLLRGTGGEEKVLKNAKDAAATEALEIATYIAIERLARATGDNETAELASDIRADEERMLDRIVSEIPKLTDAVVRAELPDHGSRGAGSAGAVDSIPTAAEADLPIARYDDLTADEIIHRLPNLSQVDLAKVAVYERAHQHRTTVLGRIDTLGADEPWPGYDEQNVAEIQAAIDDADPELAGRVRAYERSHKDRSGVLKALDREPSAS